MSSFQFRATLFFGALAASLAIAPHAPANHSASARNAAPQQDQKETPQVQQPLKVQVSLVNLYVTARDNHREIVTNLKQDDFHVYEDGVEQKVAFFSKEVDLPISLALLVDTSGSQDRVLPAEQDTASRFIHQVLHKKDEALVMSFDLDVDLLADFTEDTALLESAIRRTVISAQTGGIGGTTGTIPSSSNGGTDFYDAVYLAAHDKLGQEAGRKAIIALTDAEDTGSKLSVKDAIEAAQRADTVVHVLLISDRGLYFSQGLGYGGESVARKMADETGGRVIDVHSEKSLEKAFDQLSQELRLQYVVGYYPTNAKRDGAFRKIKVEVSRPDTKVLSRRGYYAPTK